MKFSARRKSLLASLAFVGLSSMAAPALSAYDYSVMLPQQVSGAFNVQYLITPGDANSIVFSAIASNLGFSSFAYTLSGGDLGGVYTGPMGFPGVTNSFLAIFDDASNTGITLNNGQTYTLSLFGNAVPTGATFILAVAGREGTSVIQSNAPEPGEWALMLSGLGLIGLMQRRRKSLAAV